MTVSEWSSGPLDPTLPSGEIHVWQANLDGWDSAELRARLTAPELARAAQIVRPLARSRWIVARALLRVILERYLHGEEIPLGVEPGGRPYLEKGPDFSVSHSRGVALYAVAVGARLGVDVELVRDDLPAAALRRRLASSGAPAPRQLLADWTRREAVFKCASTEPWTSAIDLGPHSVATLASAARPSRVRLWTLDTYLESPRAERRGRPTGAPI
jgi:hypothetical protein